MTKQNNNFVKKHMDQLHRPSTHVDRKRLQLLSDEAHCREGLEEFLSDTKEEGFSSTFTNND
mgnify:CR=1 FL=1